MIDLHVSISNKIATYQKRDGDIVCGNSDYQVKFTFDEEWDSHEKKTARFVWGGQFQDIEFTGSTCPVPILSGVTLCEVGVYAGDLCTTTSASIGCKTSILCPAVTPTAENDKYWANEARKYAEMAEQYAGQWLTFTPHVSEDGTLYWTNDKGLPNPDPVKLYDIDKEHPVHSLYISEDATSPASIYGGTWERLKDVFLLAAGDTYAAGSSGGSANAVVVRHNHYVSNNYGDAVNMSAGYYVANSAIGLSNSTFKGTWLSTDYTGEDGTGKNMPPYLAVYTWRRIA